MTAEISASSATICGLSRSSLAREPAAAEAAGGRRAEELRCDALSCYRGSPKVRYCGRPKPEAKTVGEPPPGGNFKISPSGIAFASATKRLPKLSKARPRGNVRPVAKVAPTPLGVK